MRCGQFGHILKNYAIHYETGELMPQELLDKVLEAQKFNQGFATTEYLAAFILDQALHQLNENEIPSAEELIAFTSFEDGIAFAVPPRYRSTYFFISLEVIPLDTTPIFGGVLTLIPLTGLKRMVG